MNTLRKDACNDHTDDVTNVSVAYRDLVPNIDRVSVGDEWYNPKWEVGGPWFVVSEDDRFNGIMYKPDFRPMRRPLKCED
jgi:hypothetical protein